MIVLKPDLSGLGSRLKKRGRSLVVSKVPASAGAPAPVVRTTMTPGVVSARMPIAPGVGPRQEIVNLVKAEAREKALAKVVAASVQAKAVVAQANAAAVSKLVPRMATATRMMPRSAAVARIMPRLAVASKSKVVPVATAMAQGAKKKKRSAKFIPKVLRKMKLKSALKAVAIAGAAMAVPGIGAGAAKLVAGGARHNAARVVKLAAKKAKLRQAVGKAVASKVRKLTVKKALKQATIKTIAKLRQDKAAAISKSSKSKFVRIAAKLAGAGGAAAIVADKLRKRAVQQYPAGANAAVPQAGAPVVFKSSSPVPPDAELRNVNELAPAASERHAQRDAQAAAEVADKVLKEAVTAAEKAQPVATAGMNPMMLAGLAAAAVFVVPMLMRGKR
jgi:hypothetical protein